MDAGHYNYYDILEIAPTCTQHEITKAYERAKNTYSGENPAIYSMFSKEEAREMLKLVEEAYSVLGNKTLRILYDEKVGKRVPLESVNPESLLVESKSIFNTPIKKPLPIKIEYHSDPEIEKQLASIQDWTGSELKKAREYKKISIEKMSEITKISSFYISAIEQCDSKNLPAPVFVRGYVGQIAKTLNIDEKTVCNSYMKHFKETLGKE